MKDIKAIVKKLRNEVGHLKPVIKCSNAFQTLVATVLSARTRDANTFRAAKQLFARFPTAKKLAKAKTSKIEKLVKPSGFYRVKARSIKKLAQQILSEFNSVVPDSLEELMRLKGVGRKTANIVLAYCFAIPAIPVDTHVHRISNRIGIVKTKTPEETEFALMKAVPKKYWIEFNNLMVKFGQKKCFPRKPNCPECLLKKHCDYYSLVFLKKQ